MDISVKGESTLVLLVKDLTGINEALGPIALAK